MYFDPPLIPGRLISRYKRFLSDIRLDTGETITAHVANPGAMLGLKAPGTEVLVSRSNNPKRKLPFSWEMALINQNWVGVNTSRPNHLVEEAIVKGTISELAGYQNMRREVPYGGNSRVDFLLEKGSGDCFLEVKNCHLMREPGLAEFPDSVTKRGTKHLEELSILSRQGIRSVVIIVVQRQDCTQFGVASDIDPNFSKAWTKAIGDGVETICYSCALSHNEIIIDKPIPIKNC